MFYMINLRIWMGLFLTQTLYYKQTCLNGKSGYITEVAELKTGDLLLRVPHKYNLFLHLDKIPCEKYRPMWLPKEDVQYNRTINHLTLPKRLSYKNSLNIDMLHIILLKNTTSNTPVHLLDKYNDEVFMQTLFYMFKNNPIGLKKYVAMGPRHLPITIRPPNSSTPHLTRIKELI